MTSTIIFSSVCAFALLAGIVTSSPVLPETELKGMQSDHACLFLCEMCFTQHVKDLLYCANNICAPGMCNAPGLVWIGHTCKNPSMLAKYLSK